jgi:hypothetical protein
MNFRMQRVIGGPLERKNLGPGAWLWSAAGGAQLMVGGGAAAEAETAGSAAPRGASVDWLEEGVLVTLITEAGAVPLRMRFAVTHEPLARLYETLPLVTLDAKARRFWRRVFLLVRIPGGRRLLKLLARRRGVPG